MSDASPDDTRVTSKSRLLLSDYSVPGGTDELLTDARARRSEDFAASTGIRRRVFAQAQSVARQIRTAHLQCLCDFRWSRSSVDVDVLPLLFRLGICWARPRQRARC
jgi:hypothetical protein